MTVELGITWLLLVPALAFAVGWLSSRIDLRQVRKAERDSPRAYYKGLNLLLNEQQDKAIDAFIEAVQHDPDTTELHFALGNLFRRRGEFERSVRVHQHLVARADLSTADRDRAQYALAQDYAKAGLFDRAEAAYRQLEHSAFATDAQRALLDLYERSREWPRAREMAVKLEASGTGSYRTRLAHHLCEQALAQRATLQPGDEAGAQAITDLLNQAHAAAPTAARPLVMLGQWAAHRGRIADALDHWAGLLGLPDSPLALVAEDLVQLVRPAPPASSPVEVSGTEPAPTGAAGRSPEIAQRQRALDLLQQAYDATGSLPVLQALNTLRPHEAAANLQAHLNRHPSLSAAAAVMALPVEERQASSMAQVRQALELSSRPLQRYRCAACGFEAQRYFWQCPGCLTWDSYPPQRIEEL